MTTDALGEGATVRDRRRWARFAPVTLAAIAIFVVIPARWENSEYFYPLAVAAIFGLAALAMDLLVGFAGVFSLGQGTFLTVGAYTSGALIVHGRWPVWAAVLAACGAGVVAALVTAPLLRLRRYYFALATIALALASTVIVNNQLTILGGTSGLPGITDLQLPGLRFASVKSYYYLGWLLCFVVGFLLWRLRSSRFGLAVRAMSADDAAAESLGVATFRIRLQVWVAASLLSALSGALYGCLVKFIAPESFGLTVSISLLVAVILGGLGTIHGALIGMAIVQLIPVFFGSFGEHSDGVYGLLTIVVFLFMPAGIAGAWPQLKAGRARRARRRAKRAALAARAAQFDPTHSLADAAPTPEGR